LSSVEFGLLGSIWAFTGFKITSLSILIPIYATLFMIQVFIATYQLWEAERKDKLLIIEDSQKKTSQIEKLSLDKDNLDQEARELRTTLLQRENDRKPKLIGSVKNFQSHLVRDRMGNTILGTRIEVYITMSNASTVPTTIKWVYIRLG
jgi:hypothetical protein